MKATRTMHPQLGPEWLPDCRAFLAHWCQLRGDALMPASELFLDSPPAALLPNCYVAELTAAGAVVRFHGGELISRWGRDFTNIELHDGGRESMKARSVENMGNIVNRPCGMMIKLVFSSSFGRRMTAEMIQLPLATKPGRPPRFAAFSLSQDVREPHETVNRYLKTHRLDWIDIGAGVPTAPPFDLAS